MLQILADNVAGTEAAQTAIESRKTPFLPGRVVEAHITGSEMTGTVPSIKIQSSPDNSDWTDVLELAHLNAHVVANVVCDRYMRATSVTEAGSTVGRYSAWLSSGD